MQSMLSLRDIKVGSDLMSKDKKEKKKTNEKSHSIHLIYTLIGIPIGIISFLFIA